MLATIADSEQTLSIQNVSIDCALKLDEDKSSQLQVIRSSEDQASEADVITVYSEQETGVWQQHAAAQLVPEEFISSLHINICLLYASDAADE